MYDHILKPWMLVSQFLGKWLAFTEFRPIILSFLSMIHLSQSSKYLKSPYLCYENCHFDSLYQMISITTYYPDDIILWLIIWYASTKQQKSAIYVCYRFHCLMKFTEVSTKDLQIILCLLQGYCNWQEFLFTEVVTCRCPSWCNGKYYCDLLIWIVNNFES